MRFYRNSTLHREHALRREGTGLARAPGGWRRAVWGGLALALLGSVFGCAPGSKSQAPPSATPAGVVQVPDHFVVVDSASAATREPKPGEGCHNPMVDPKDGAKLTLVRSSNGMGDYDVPEGRYGVGRGQLLRLDCANGRPMGVVTR